MLYRGIRFSHSHKASDADIRKHELRFGAPFPDEYVEFLRHADGGRPRPRLFTYKKPTSDKPFTHIIDVFYGIRKCEFSMQWALDTYVKTKRLPKGSLPIASLEFSDVIYIQSSDGHVYYWFCEGEGEEPENCKFLATSFNEFLSLIHK